MTDGDKMQLLVLALEPWNFKTERVSWSETIDAEDRPPPLCVFPQK
jgi:hypothetical protein